MALTSRGRTLVYCAAVAMSSCTVASAWASGRPVQSVRSTTSSTVKKISGSVVTITTSKSQGSGVIVDASGVIVTNLHVIRGQNSVSVKLANGDIYDDVSVIDVDARKDLVLLKIKAVDLYAPPLGNSDQVEIGERIVVVGSPQGLDLTVSDGIVSAIRDSGEGYRLIQTNAAASHGSSGGGLFDEKGQLVGVITLKLEQGENLNFAVPSNYIRGMLATRPTMSLAQLATQYPATESRASSRSTDTASSPTNQQAQLETVLNATGFKSITKKDGYWQIAFKGSAKSVLVTVAVVEGMVITQSTVASNYSSSQGLSASLLNKSYLTNYAKLGTDEDGSLVVLNESELRILDGASLKNIIDAVATASDETYVLMTAPVDASPLIGPEASSQPRTATFLKGHDNIRYDGAAWKAEDTRDRSTVQFAHSSGGAWIKVISEPLLVPMEKMADVALVNARSVDPKATEVRRGSRLVNGRRMTFLEYAATVENYPIVFYAHFYSDDAGTLQIIGWSSKTTIDSYRSKIESFVSGFYLGRR